MAENPALKATLAEWRTVLAAARHYKEHLLATAPDIADEDEQLVAFDHVERLDRLVPNLERQLQAIVERESSGARREL